MSIASPIVACLLGTGDAEHRTSQKRFDSPGLAAGSRIGTCFCGYTSLSGSTIWSPTCASLGCSREGKWECDRPGGEENQAKSRQRASGHVPAAKHGQAPVGRKDQQPEARL